MSYHNILVEERLPGIAQITFNRPDVKNALNLQMVQEIHRALDEFATKEHLRALVFAGSETAFVSGADIAELRQRKRADALAKINSTLLRKVELFPLPTIAAIRGYALGGGCEFALACDIRIAGEGATFGQPEVSLGILPGAGATYRLPRAVGHALARELIFTGRLIRASEAKDIGLINRLVPDLSVLDTAITLAQDIAKNSALAVRLAKSSLNAAIDSDTETLISLDATAQAVLFEDDEKNRRMTAFLERKKSR